MSSVVWHSEIKSRWVRAAVEKSFSLREAERLHLQGLMEEVKDAQGGLERGPFRSKTNLDLFSFMVN